MFDASIGDGNGGLGGGCGQRLERRDLTSQQTDLCLGLRKLPLQLDALRRVTNRWEPLLLGRTSWNYTLFRCAAIAQSVSVSDRQSFGQSSLASVGTDRKDSGSVPIATLRRVSAAVQTTPGPVELLPRSSTG